MIRIIIACLLLVHGIVQALGFFKEFNLEKVIEVSEKRLFPFSKTTSKIIGILWMLSSLLFMGTALFFFLQLPWWWMFAGGAILVSQFLIIVHWQNAKFSTIINIILLALMLPAYGNWIAQVSPGSLWDFWG